MMTVGHHLRPTAITSRDTVPPLFLRSSFAVTSLFLLEQIDGSAKEEPFLCIFAKKQQSNDSDIKKSYLCGQ